MNCGAGRQETRPHISMYNRGIAKMKFFLGGLGIKWGGHGIDRRPQVLPILSGNAQFFLGGEGWQTSRGAQVPLPPRSPLVAKRLMYKSYELDCVCSICVSKCGCNRWTLYNIHAAHSPSFVLISYICVHQTSNSPNVQASDTQSLKRTVWIIISALLIANRALHCTVAQMGSLQTPNKFQSKRINLKNHWLLNISLVCYCSLYKYAWLKWTVKL